MSDEFDFTPTEMTEFALDTAKNSEVAISTRLNWSAQIPTVWVAFKKEVCIPQTQVHKTLQQSYGMVTIASVTIGGVTGVSYMHRDNYDWAVESTTGQVEVAVE